MAILVRTQYDSETNVLYAWAEDILTYAHIIKERIEGSNVTYDQAQTTLKGSLREQYKYFIFYGHGSVTGEELLGHNNVPIITLSEAYLFKDRIVYTVACHSAKVLGPKCIDEGAIAYFGYVDELNVPLGESTTIKNIFKEPANIGLESVFKMWSLAKVKKAIEKSYKDHIRFLSSNGRQELALALSQNCKRFRLLPETV